MLFLILICWKREMLVAGKLDKRGSWISHNKKEDWR